MRGFTLVELMIVIMIVMILTVLTMGSYAGVQRSARLDYAADTFVAVMKEQMTLARSGRVDAADELLCFAVKVEGGVMYTRASEYVAVGSAGVDYCSDVGREWEVVDGLEGEAIEVSDDFEVYFKPPFGKADSDVNEEVVEISLNGGESRKVKVNTEIGEIARI